MSDADIPLLSASLAFSTLLSAVPFLAVGFAVLHAATGMDGLARELQSHVFAFFESTIGADGGAVLQKVLGRLARRSWTVTSAVVLILTSIRIFVNLEVAVNRIWLARDVRPWWRRWMTVLWFYFFIPFGLAGYAGLRSANLMRPMVSWNPLLWDALIAMALLFAINRWLPAPRVHTVAALIGSAVSAAGLLLLGATFKWLTVKVFVYSKIYGSLAALPLLCLWILLMWQIILAGVAVAAALQSPVPRGK